MSKSIKVEFNYSKDLALKASKLFYDYDMKNSSKRYIGWLFIALMQFGVVGALKHDSFGLLFVSTFLVIYWYYIRWYVRKSMILKYYDSLNLDNNYISSILDSEGLSFNNELIAWEKIVKVIKFDDGVLVQTLENSLFFENSAFKKESDYSEFIKIMREKGKI